MPTTTRTIRVFVSSTFEDLKAERNALQERVFPELVNFCASKGARFQAVDLRWGVREEASLDQRTMEICLAEIARCQKTGIKPNFIVLLGDRYGQIPLLARIRKDEFEPLLTHVTTEERKLLVFDNPAASEDTGWYRLDWNAVPPEYLLKAREGEYKERSRWEPIKTRIREALRKAAHAAGVPETDLVNYEASATHQEVLAGLGGRAQDREHVFAFVRNPETPKDPGLKGLIKILRRELPVANIVPFSEGDLDGLCQRVMDRLKKVIEAEAARFESQSALEQEKGAQSAFARDRCRHFVGRTAVLEEIDTYLEGNDRLPLLVHGPSGCGKSAIIAMASEEHTAIRRFIGATPESSNGVPLLRSLCEEIGERYGQAGDLPATFNELAVLLRDRLRLATAARPLVLYIDAIDQFGSQDPAAAMGWFPRKLPPNCRAVLATTDVPAALAKAKLVAVETFSVDEARETLDLWLKDAKRVLQTTQREKVLDSFSQTGLPLYLKLAFEEARLWRSFDPVDQCFLGEGLAGIIDRLLMRLSAPANHGEILVRHALGFLTVARYGMTEDEMLDVLSADEEVWRDFEQRARHRPPEHRLPVVVWSRLFLDLEPYLTERSAPGGNVVSFYHHQIADQVRQRFPRNDDFPLRWHGSLSAYFDRQPAWAEHEKLPNFRMLSELPGHLIESRLWDRLEDRLTDLDFMEASASFDRCFDLIGIFRDALARLPTDRPRRILLELIGETLNLDLDFISRHPSALFQCFWNRCWWFDAPAAASYYEDQKNGAAPETSESVKISDLMEVWLKLKEARTPGFLWVRALHPPKTALGSPLVAVYGGLQATATCVACSEDGRYIGAGCSDGSVHLWDSTTGAEVLNFEVELAKYSPITVETDWARKHERHAPSHEPHSIRGIALLNGERFLTDCGDDAIRVRDHFRGEEIACFPGHSKGVQAFTCSSDRRLLLSTSCDGTVRIWNVETGVEIQRLPGEEHSGAYAVAFSPDGSHFACGGIVKGTRSIRVYESTSGREVCCLEGFIGVPHSAAFSPDGSLLAFGLDDGGAKDNTVRIYDWRTRNQLHCLSHRLPVTSVAFSPDGARLASATAQTNPLASLHGMRFAGEIKIWTVQNGEEALSLPGHEDGVYGLAFLPSGSKLISASADPSVRIWDLNRALLTRSVVGDGGLLHRLLVSPDGSRMLSWSELKGAHLWSSFNGRLEGRIEHDARVIDAAFSPDGNTFALSISDRGVRVFHTTTRAEITRFDGHRGNVVGVVFAPDGSRIASLGTDGTVRLWEAVSGLEHTCFSGYQYRLRCAAFSPNGSFLATGTGKMDIADSGRGDGELKVWQIDTSSALISVEDFPFVVRSVAFSPDGKILAAGAGVRGFAETDTNSEIRIFSIEGRSEIARKLDFGGRLMNIAFSPDGQAIVADAEAFISIYNNHGSRVIEFPGMADVEEVAGAKPYRGVIAFAGDETHIDSISTGDEVAWYPGRLERLRAHPIDAMWAGTAGAHLVIIKLEGSQVSSSPLPRTVWDFPQIQSPKNGEQPATVVAARREIRAAARRNVWRAIFCLIPAYLLAHTKWGRWLGVPFYVFAAFLLAGSLRGWLLTARQK